LLSVLTGVSRDLEGAHLDAAGLGQATGRLAEVDRLLRGSAGLRALLAEPGTVGDFQAVTDGLSARIADLEIRLDHDSVNLTTLQQEQVNAALIGLKDAWWAIGRDRLSMARAVSDLIGGPAGEVANLDGWWSIQVALASLDRLEVRGRDSAGVHVLVSGHGLDVSDPAVKALIGGRASDILFASGAVRVLPDALGFVYKAAAEIGELGDNVRALRHEIASDRLLALALGSPGARTTVVGHTRWASVGIISQPNAHPLNSEETGDRTGPYVAAALNGDVHNNVELRQSE